MKITTEYDYSKTWTGLPAPDGWHVADHIHDYHTREIDGYLWERLYGKRITVMESVRVESDGRRWLHVSVANPNNKLPTYEDIQAARKLFIGEHRECYMVFPTKERYLNYNEVLHLWTCLDAEAGVLPHFEQMVRVNGQERLSV